jgi:predicted PurR-regulated permease PerM
MLESALQNILDQGVLGAILIILFLVFKKFIEQLFRVVQNNTKALEQVSNSVKQMQESVRRCHERSILQ